MDRGILLTLRSSDAGRDLEDGSESNPSTYAELMTLYDDAFVEAAYLLLLGRAADPIGLDYYCGRLRSGYSRTSVLDQLVRSPEVLNDWSERPGLSDAVRRFRWSRRISGLKLALTDPELGRTAAICRARALQNSIASQRQQLEDKMAKLAAQNDVVKHMVWELGESRGSPPLNHHERPEHLKVHVRPRRVEAVRDFDLPPLGRAVLDTLRF